MKTFQLTCIFLFVCILQLTAQNSIVYSVKYKDLKSATVLGTYNYWFTANQLVTVRESNLRAMYMRGFPVLINGKMTTQSDTVTYNKEFNEFIQEMADDQKKQAQTISFRELQSSILKMSYYNDYLKKNFIVHDTLPNMDGWKMLDEIVMFMGFRCQKAILQYKNEEYTALFTPEIPINAGPNVFRGLPGLILKVSNKQANMGYEAIEIQAPFKGSVPTFVSKGEIISYKEWIVMLRERNQKSTESMKNMINDLKKQGAVENQ